MQYVHGFARSQKDLKAAVSPYGRALRCPGSRIKNSELSQKRAGG